MAGVLAQEKRRSQIGHTTLEVPRKGVDLEAGDEEKPTKGNEGYRWCKKS